jgi:excisionase family DNA binding protein
VNPPPLRVSIDLPEAELRRMMRDVVREELARANQAPPGSPYMTVPEAAEYLRCQPQRIHNLLSEGRLTRVKDGGRTLLLREEIERHLHGEVVGPVGAAARRVASLR